MRIRTSAARAAGSLLAPLMVVGVAACSNAGSGSSGPGPSTGAGKTLTVWYMDGELSTDGARRGGVE